MSDVTPTPEQIAAYRDLADPARIFTAGQMALLAPLLPDALTNPQPALPTEPGVYIDGHDAVVIRSTTRWRVDGAYVDPSALVQPLRRLVVEDDTPHHVFTGKELQESYLRHTGTGSEAAWNAVAAYVNTKEA